MTDFAIITITPIDLAHPGLAIASARAGAIAVLDREHCPADKLSTGLYEAHGTGTVVGDQAEIETVVTALKQDDAAHRACAIGSIKTLIGHTKMTAGAVGLTKAVLSLYHKVLPPHWGVKDPLEAISDSHSPVYLLKDARPWFAQLDHPRRSGVSAFGFGGTNTHALLEEYSGDVDRRAPGGSDWPVELFFFSADSHDELRTRLKQMIDALGRRPRSRLCDLAFSAANSASGNARSGTIRLSIVSDSISSLEKDMKLVLSVLDGTSRELPANIRLNTIDSPPASVAFCFPGQGSQYVGMAREVALYFNELRDVIEAADELLKGHFDKLLSQYIYPPAAFTAADETTQEAELTATHVAQTAIGAVSAGFFAILKRLGINPHMVCGHSYGEYTALFAAEALSLQDFLRLSEARGRIMGSINGDTGTMAALSATREEISQVVADFPGVVIANHNSPSQVVISGAVEELQKVIARLNASRRSRMLPVSAAFHSPLMTSATVPLQQAIAECVWQSPSCPVYSNTDGGRYENDPPALIKRISRHLLSSVEFVRQVESMYADGARTFLEVGPRNTLTGLIRKILEGRPHQALAIEGDERGMRGFLLALANLFSLGVELQPAALFAGRDVETINFDEARSASSDHAEENSGWLLTGAGVRERSQKVALLGNTPFVTQEDLSSGRVEVNESRPPQLRTALPDPLPGAPPARGEVAAAYQAYQETMRQFLVLQEEALKQFLGTPREISVTAPNNGNGFSARSLSADEVAAHPEDQNGGRQTAQPATPQVSSIPPAAAETSAAPANGDVPIDRANLTRTVMNVVKEHTGYPEEMLGFEMDIEAELGIDSIKRIEILEALQRELPAKLRSQVRQGIDQLTRVKSLGELLDRLLAWVSPATASSSPPDITVAKPSQVSGQPESSAPAVEESAFSVSDEDFTGSCPRWVLEPHEQSLPATSSRPLEGRFIITEDEMSVAAHVAEALRSRGAITAILKKEILASPVELGRAMCEIVGPAQPITGILHLAGLSTEEMPEDLARWRVRTQVQQKSLFQILRSWTAETETPPPGYVLSASVLGGFFGRVGECGPGLPCASGSSGLLKTLAAEWPGVITKAVDFDVRLSAQEIAQHLLNELLTEENSPEVGYSSGQRTIFRTTRSLLDTTAEPDLQPAADWVILATGGARGITAAATKALAVRGMTIVLVGNTPLAEEPIETARIADLGELRRVLAARDSGNVPAQIERQLQQLLKQREIKRNLSQFEQAGVKVDYRVVDVRDADAFGALMEEIYAGYGRIDAVLHGAGIIEDKLLLDKSIESFDRVFDTKVDSTFILYRCLRPSLKLIVFFSSVASRVGNRGQSDYAAANEVMNRFAWHMSKRFATRVVAINWGPWAGVGLASDAVNRQFKDRGIVPIPADDGCRFFLNEIKFGARHHVEVVAGDGPWSSESIDAQYDLGDLLLDINELSEHAWMM